MTSFRIDALEDLAARALRAAGASAQMAQITAGYLVAADARGLSTHGVTRLPTYCLHLKAGRVRGDAEPRILRDLARRG